MRRSLELAHLSLVRGGLPVGAVLVDPAGVVVAEGRNRAYDAPGGNDPLQRTPLAYAEMNALARIDTDTDLGRMTLWSSHRPCGMCAAACSFVGVGSVRFVAPDPSDDDHSDPAYAEQVWIVTANLMFLAGVRALRGDASPMLARARTHEPEVMHLVDTRDLRPLYRPTLDQAVADMWESIGDAAHGRAQRVTPQANAGHDA